MPISAGSSLSILRLKRGEDRRLAAGHLWVFSNEVDTAATPLGAFEAGALVRVVTDRDRFVGYAYVNPHALICARILSTDPQCPPTESWLAQRLTAALKLRQRCFDLPYYRLAYGESDLLPGLVVDRYGDVLVAQIGTAGMERFKPQIAAALEQVIPGAALLWKNDSGARELEGLESYVETGSGVVPPTVQIMEHGARFEVPLAEGQKTGWFFDQALNRQAFLRYVKGARVLDVCSYLGGWGIAAAVHGAARVTSVDVSAPALKWQQLNAQANGAQMTLINGNAFEALESLNQSGERFDVVVLDPPAFIRRRKDIPKGQAAYKRLNRLGMQVLQDGGMLVSCSCSHHLSEDDLLQAVQRAARSLDRFVQVLHTGSQAPDHPLHPAIPETRYLKAFFCRVTSA